MNQKLEELLRLALQTPEAVRLQTEELNVGFDGEGRTWELIVKYHGNLDGLATLGIVVEYLIAGYAILTVPETLVEVMAALDEIEYVEKPKRYFYSQQFANRRTDGSQLCAQQLFGQTVPTRDSCLEQVANRSISNTEAGVSAGNAAGSSIRNAVGSGRAANDAGLTGNSTLLAVLDSGIDYTLPEFQNADGTSRILFLWDQTLRPERFPSQSPSAQSFVPPAGFAQGVEFTTEQINRALAASNPQERFQLLPSVDTSGHGTAVAGIAAGNSDRYRGVAPAANLLIVKLGLPDATSFPRTTEIMRGVTYAVNKAVGLGMPLVINLSFGNTYGAHSGNSLLERFLDNAAEIGRTVICVGSGNEGNNGGHAAGSLRATTSASVELAIADYERSLSVQLWKNYSDTFHIVLRSPGGQEVSLPETVNGGKYTLRLEQTEILVYMGEPTPYSAEQEIYLELIPVGRNYINSGVWTFRLEVANPNAIVSGNYYFYLPSATVRSSGTGFYRSNPTVTLTIPSTATRVITVGAYDPVYDAYADFSGRGYAAYGSGNNVSGRGYVEERLSAETGNFAPVIAGLTKPDLVAPGVNVPAPDIYGGLVNVTGTSFATPIVAGSAALLMEWGIVQGNDLFLYGEKVKAYLRKGARPLRGENIYPNEKVGWGKLCVRDSLPM